MPSLMTLKRQPGCKGGVMLVRCIAFIRSADGTDAGACNLKNMNKFSKKIQGAIGKENLRDIL